LLARSFFTIKNYFYFDGKRKLVPASSRSYRRSTTGLDNNAVSGEKKTCSSKFPEVAMEFIFHTMIDLIKNMTESTTAGAVGVSMIFLYLAWIIFIGIRRVRQASAADHH
jgi:hypothetical protein